MELAARFNQQTGSSYYLTAEAPERVADYLHSIDYLNEGERVTRVTPAGEGNMNVTLRITTGRHSFILKQSRPWVAKYPELKAPVDRILTEHHFSQAIAQDKFLRGRMPEVLRVDATNYVLLLEDLGEGGDLSSIYGSSGNMKDVHLKHLLQFVTKLHRLQPANFPPNRALKKLNHAHIFDLPFRPDNGFPLDAFQPGLATIALPYQHDDRLRKMVTQLGKEYLATGSRLIHGDFYPGSFLTSAEGKVYVIDTEFAHLGRPEFDLGVLMAHLLLSGAEEGRILQLDRDYDKPPGFSGRLSRQFCYVEIMRRLIGIAQLPLSLTLEERERLLDRARAGLT